MKFLLAIMLGITSSAIAVADRLGDPEDQPRATDDTAPDADGSRDDRTGDPEPPREQATLRVESFGRQVSIELLDIEPLVRCVTPCVVRVRAGAHRARVDGLDRTLYADGNPTYVTPTRRGRQALGLVAAVLGSAGGTLACHWASPLDGSQRLIAGLGSLGMFALAIPLITSSSAKVLDGRGVLRRPQPSQVELLAGAQLGGDRTFAGGAFGFRPADRWLGVRAGARFATDAADVYQILIGGTLYAPRLPIVQPTLTLSTGVASHRDPVMELELGDAARTRIRPLVELDGQLSIEVPWPVKPRAGIAVQKIQNSELGVIVDVGLITRL